MKSVRSLFRRDIGCALGGSIQVGRRHNGVTDTMTSGYGEAIKGAIHVVHEAPSSCAWARPVKAVHRFQKGERISAVSA